MGFLMWATVESLRLELGYSGELFVVPAKLGDNLTDSWITHLWHISHEEQLLLLTDFASPPLQWVHGIEIMCLFVDSGQKQPNLKMLNNCWMFLHAFYLSKIS